jgi:2',3'-cyclic-nucleotide 2'-phosphodiesterase (5'-nucleotidase family)
MRRLVLYIGLLIWALFLVSCHPAYLVSNTTFTNNRVGKDLVAEDSTIIRLYSPYKTNLEKDMSNVIGFAPENMEKGKPESLLTNFLGDLLLNEGNNYLEKEGKNYKASISYFNYGGIRTYIPQGDITVGRIFELMPFENELVFLKLKGNDLKAFLDNIARRGGDSLGGVRFLIKNGTAEEILVNGQPLDTNSEYWLATNDYIAGGGDDMSMLKNHLELITTGRLIRDIIIGHLEKMKEKRESVSPKLDGRIKHG